MAQNDFLDEHVGKVSTGYQLTFDKLIDKLNTDVYGREMRNDITTSVKALGSAINDLHDSSSGVGWTDYQIDLLETILKAAAYADTGIGDEINRLIASLRGTSLLVDLQVSPDAVTVNAGDDLDSIRNEITVTAISTDGYVENNEIIDDYNLNGSLIQGKDCPISVSYTKDGFTISKTITVTVRERQPSSMTARLFGNVSSLPIGVTSAEIKDAIYAQARYNDGYVETISDLIVENETVKPYINRWSVMSNKLMLTASVSFNGDAYISSSGRTKVVYLLEGCSSTNTETEIPSGENFNTIISPDHGSIESLKVFVDGYDRTSLFVSNSNIVNVLGAYVTEYGHIVISAKASENYTIIYHLTNCTSSNTDATIPFGSVYSTIIKPNDGYEIDFGVAKTYAHMGSSVFPAASDGLIFIPNATNNIDVYGVAKPASGGEVTLTSISASYTGGTVAAGTTLEQLTGIVVTAMYSNGTTSTIPSSEYSLSGTLTSGQTNTVTVSYSGKTATFEVTVEAGGGEPTENYDLNFLATNSDAVFNASATGVQTFGDNQTYTTVSETIKANKCAKISEKITYNSSKVYTITASPVTSAIRFQLAYFDASGNLSGYSTWASYNDMSDVGTIESVFTLSGTTLTRNKGGTVTSEPQSMGNAAWFAVYVRSKGNLVEYPERFSASMNVTDAP